MYRMSEQVWGCVMSQCSPWLTTILSLVTRWQGWPVISLWDLGGGWSSGNLSLTVVPWKPHKAAWRTESPSPPSHLSLNRGVNWGARCSWVSLTWLLWASHQSVPSPIAGSSHSRSFFSVRGVLFSRARGLICIQHSGLPSNIFLVFKYFSHAHVTAWGLRLTRWEHLPKSQRSGQNGVESGVCMSPSLTSLLPWGVGG